MIKINTYSKKFEKQYYETILKPGGRSWGIEQYFNKYRNDIPSDLSKELLEYLIPEDGDIYNSILIQRPKELKESRDKIELLIEKYNDPSIKDNLKPIFNYSNFSDRFGYHLAYESNIEVCPYCNRNWTPNLKSAENNIVRCEFDHFFPKSEYPYLGLSLYNLVPSCHTCNKLKRELEVSYNPFEIGYSNKIKFELQSSSVDGILGNPNFFKILIKNHSNSSQIEKQTITEQLKTLKLRNIYKRFHNKNISLFIRRSYIHSDEYLEYLYSQYHGTLFSSMDELKSIVFGAPMQEEDIGKMPLGKLTYDILRELRGED